MSEEGPKANSEDGSGLDPLVRHLTEKHRLALLGSLAGKIVHGMNNTLTGLKANIPYLKTCLQSPGDGEEIQTVLQEIQDATTTLERMVQAFDQYLRGEEEPGPVNLWEALDMAHTLVEPKVRYSVDLRLPAAREPAIVHARNDHIIQLFTGVLLHIDARPAQFGEVSVRLMGAEGTTDDLVLEFLDLRPAGIMAHVPDGSHPEAGLDPEIGLFLCQHIARDHGGTLEIDVPRTDVTRYRCNFVRLQD